MLHTAQKAGAQALHRARELDLAQPRGELTEDDSLRDILSNSSDPEDYRLAMEAVASELEKRSLTSYVSGTRLARICPWPRPASRT